MILGSFRVYEKPLVEGTGIALGSDSSPDKIELSL
jgi:hypothetical protein